MTNKILAPSAFVLVLLLAVFGCNSNEPSAPATPTPTAGDSHDDHDHEGGDNHEGHDHEDGDDHDAHEGHDHGDASASEGSATEDSAQKTDMEKMTETLASFSEEDRASAMKQHTCPVTGEMLGTMGKPEKIDVNGESVWICCDGCKDKLLADPDKYLKK